MDLIYLDHAAATPIRPEVSATMATLSDRFGNPSSVHRWGREARAALEDARERTAASLRTGPRQVHFVRGGTESVNLAILGRVDWVRSQGQGSPRLFRSPLEHPAVREAMETAALMGSVVEVIPISQEGELALPDEEELRAGGAQLVSVQWVNQETGLVLPVPEVAELCGKAGVPLHVDAVQAAGKIPLELDRTPVALLSLSGHKLGGPRSTGVLVIAEGTEIHARLFGGGQEQDIRPGTEDVAGAVGFARALELSVLCLEEEATRLTALRRRLETGLRSRLPGLRIHGAEGARAPHILSLGVPGLPRDVLPGALDLAGIGVSAGSACRSGTVALSPILEALYGSDAEHVAPLRLSLGWSTTQWEVDETVRRIPPIIERMWKA